MALTKLNSIDLIVIFSYYFLSLFLALSLSGFFKKEYLFAGASIGIALFLLFLRTKVDWEKSHCYFFIGTPLVLIGVLLIRGCFGGDGISFWLPWAREIILQARMPDFLFNTPVWAATRMPLTALFHAGIFSFFGFSDWAIAFPSFFFASGCLLLLYIWLQEKGLSKKYVIFGVLLLLINPLFLDRAGEIGQEPFILFFFSATLYYLEKLKKDTNLRYFWLALASAVLAALSKESGLLLFLPILWLFFRDKIYKQWFSSLLFVLLLTLPLLSWLLRNYLIYDNPLFPLLDSIFKSRYSALLFTTNSVFQTYIPSFWINIPLRFADIFTSLIALFCPLAVLSFYGFYLKRKIQYIVLFLFFFLLVFFVIPNPGDYCRYFMPLSIVFIVYAVSALAETRSKILLSAVFFVDLGILFLTNITSSQSQLFIPFENNFRGLLAITQIFHNYAFVIALVLGVIFYYVIAQNESAAKSLILISVAVFSARAYSFNLGSWLNIWMPILALVFLTLIWRYVALVFKECALWKLGAVISLALLLFNAWGLASAYALTHRQIIFPNFDEAYGVQPEAAKVIENFEGQNRDFYIYAASGSYFPWYGSFKTVISRGMTFHVITNLEWRESFNTQEIHDLFQRSNIKYIINNHPTDSKLLPFFEKISSRPDLFAPIFKKTGAYLWQVK